MTVDIAQVEAFLRSWSGDDARDLATRDLATRDLAARDLAARDLAAIGRGAWSQAFAFSSQGAAYVIRFGAHREDFDKDRLAARYASPALPIPRVVEVGEAYGGHYCIAERLYGDYIDEVDEAQMRALLPALFAALDAARDVDLAPTHGWGGWGGDGHAPHRTWAEALLSIAGERPRLAGWRARLEASAVGVAPFDLGLARLAQLAEGLHVSRHLIHMDLLHFNVLVTGDRITGVLDWGCGMYGDHLYDLAWLCFWQPWYPQWQRIDFRAEALRHYAAIGLDVPQFDERLACCMLHMGIDGLAYQAWVGDAENLPLTAERTLAIASS